MSQKQPERTQTDDSLRSERARTDRELEKKRASIEEDSDEVLARANDRADEVLKSARAKADTAGLGSSAALEVERTAEDRALAEERTTKAAQLTSERDERRRALAELLRFEREVTDKDLLLERRGADAALVTRDEFLGMVSHDLRSLLGGIAVSTSFLLKEAPDDDSGKKVVKRAEGIQRFTARMNRLLSDLLDVVSIEAGQLHVRPAPDDATQVLRESVDIFQPAATAQGISLSLAGPPGPLLANFDHERILQVLANLLSNALKFTKEGGRIELRAEAQGPQCEISVTDTGSGIPPDQLDTVFERFSQVNKFDRRGHGLGLHISKCIVEAHGGRIWVESGIGTGSTFRFTLPLVKQEQG
ncbi:sensor histidine kinase [Myxococcus qinghaiensis]|uniref:sensor histidine kinase n=1 Tax=Myxococcus qinghaiensis TaxID=2906758 RepID=UPI0020A7D51E|nr:ATP-binding protein [Myxococcus qinghaiensis]MCP3167938.1 ATP-binding protein [Myxococcus qinghaiensis]